MLELRVCGDIAKSTWEKYQLDYEHAQFAQVEGYIHMRLQRNEDLVLSQVHKPALTLRAADCKVTQLLCL